MLRAEVKHDIFDDNISIKIDKEDVNSICYDFDLFVHDLIELLDGEQVQRLSDVVLFKIPDIKRVYGICKDEYLRLVFTFNVQLHAFTMEEFETIQKMIEAIGDMNVDFVC